MKNRLWVFPALTCLLCAIFVLGQQRVVAALALSAWLLRIYCLKNRKLLKSTIIISLLFVGALMLHQQNKQTQLTGQETRLLVTPEATSVKIDGDSLRFTATTFIPHESEKAKEEKIRVRYYFQTKEEKAEWLTAKVPKHLLLQGEMIQPSVNSNFYQFNYRDYLKRNGIYWQFNACELQKIENTFFKTPRFYFIEKIRAQLIASLENSFHPKIASYLQTLFLADRRSLPEEVLQNYRALGVIHLFSISGFHITYLAHLFKRLLLRLGITHETSDFVLIFALPTYGVLTGFGVSVFRAVTQEMLKVSSRLVKRELSTLDAWAAAMLAALFLNPYQVFDLSFQLSYTISGLFILFGSQSWLRQLRPSAYTFLFSFLSGLASLPILSYHFFEISWITVFANLLFMPLFSQVLFPALLLLLLFSLFLTETQLFAFLNELFVFFLNEIENLLSLLTKHFNFIFITGRLPAIIGLLLVVCIFYCLIRIEQKKRPSVLTVFGVVSCLLWHRISPISYVVMLDVGQGDAFLVRDGSEKKVTLIDTGGQANWQNKKQWQEGANPFSIGEDILVPAIKAFGISKIDRLYISHADVDHMGEVAAVCKEIKVKEIASTKKTFKEPLLLNTLAKLDKPEIIEINPLEILELPTAQTVALHPQQNFQNKNNQSLVLYVKIGEDYWLFTGDIEAEIEAAMVREYPALKADYLKVAHHGSRSSTTREFLEVLEPKTALISAGAKNTFGHPSAEVVDCLVEKDIEIYSTIDDGAVKVSYFNRPLSNKWVKITQTVK